MEMGSRFMRGPIFFESYESFFLADRAPMCDTWTKMR